MTRFARARGSKSSNERLPEVPTSWEVMKQQLLEAQQVGSSVEEQPRKVLSLEEESPGGGKSEWAVFEEQCTQRKSKSLKVSGTDKVKKKKIGKNHTSYTKDNNGSSLNDIKDGNKIKKKKVKRIKLSNVSDTLASIKLLTTEPGNIKGTKAVEDRTSKIEDDYNVIKKYKMNKLKTTKANSESETLVSAKAAGCEQKELAKNAYNKTLERKELKSNKNKLFKKKLGSFNDVTHKKIDKPYKRRKPDEGTTVLYLNGKEVKVRKFGGFPVKTEDADRLEELYRKMVEKKVPQHEIRSTMKLERRKAEKALSRERRKVCFHCRKAGHNLSECPMVGSGKEKNTFETGICFKCGSTEHTHFECRVMRGQEFRYATCFVCNEQGHIARQCSDNPRGLYPKGGGCRVCGDVTHLKKDCPDLIKEKEENVIRLDILNTNSLEDLNCRKVKSQSAESSAIKRKNVVKF